MNMRPSPRRHDGGASTQKHVYPVTGPNPPMCKVAAVWVTFCGGVRCSGGCSCGGGDVSVHRCRGFDPSVGSRRGRDAGAAGPRKSLVETAFHSKPAIITA
jgi:hypothetical protein